MYEPVRKPIMPPTKVSEGKCFLAVMRKAETVPAPPRARYSHILPGYSSPSVAAQGVPTAACPEGNEVPLSKKSPLLPGPGRCRLKIYFSPPTDPSANAIDSHSRTASSRRCRLCSWHPTKYLIVEVLRAAPMRMFEV